MKKTLVYGYGNPGRQDDALGVLLIEKLERWIKENHISNIDTDTNYQLNIEDAYGLDIYDTIIFADASLETDGPFKIVPIKPMLKPSFTMHAVSPSFVIGLCREVYGYLPKAYLLHIKGFKWEFMSDLSSQAEQNLHLAFEFLCDQFLAAKPAH